MLKILHAADLHLDSAFSGRSQGATARLRSALRAIPKQSAALCRAERCDWLLLAGDVFDGIPKPETLRELKRTLQEDSGLNGLQTQIPAGTRLNSIRVERRICHVDLSEEFLDKADPTWAMRVITASLCTLEGISAVRITVNGAVPEGYSPQMFGVWAPKDAWFL